VPGAYKVQGGPPTGVMDPSSEKTFQFITGLFNDFNTLFPDNMIMLGGDEVFTSCYKENPNIDIFMKTKGIATYTDLFQYHIDRTKQILNKINPKKQALYWSNEDTLYLKHQPDDVLLWWG